MTSIEWLLSELDKVNHHPTEAMVMYAKKLHKEEIIDAVGVGSQFDRDYLYGYHDKAEQYYQETFKKFSLMDETPSAPASDKTMCEYSGLRSVTSYIETKENTYTEEQVREVIRNFFKSNADGFVVTEDDMMRTIKNSKKDKL